MWDFIWEGKVNQIKRDVYCLDIENGGMSMVNLDSYIDSRRIRFIYRIINESIENWNAIRRNKPDNGYSLRIRTLCINQLDEDFPDVKWSCME